MPRGSWCKGLTKETDERIKRIAESKKGNKCGKGKRTGIALENIRNGAKEWHSSERCKEHMKRIQKIGSIAGANAVRGKPAHNKGKKAVGRQIYGLEIGRHMKKTEKQRLTGVKNLRGCRTRISRPQQRLFLWLKKYFPDAELEYPIKTNKTYRFADVGIPSFSIDFEYDGFHYLDHHNKKSDTERDKELADVGWITFRVNESLLGEMTPEIGQDIGILVRDLPLLACNTPEAKKKGWETRKKNGEQTWIMENGKRKWIKKMVN